MKGSCGLITGVKALGLDNISTTYEHVQLRTCEPEVYPSQAYVDPISSCCRILPALTLQP